MEMNRRSKRSPSGDKFSFPVITNHDSSDEFEFGSVTSPASPSTSPADHLFSNGKLLPHSFPIQSPNAFASFSRSTSRASKDSLMSSRSNSTNSRSSTSTSARTSTSDAATPERRPLPPPPPHDHYGAGRKKERINGINARPDGMSWPCQYGSARTWQLIAAAPALKQQRARPRRADRDVGVVVDRKLRGGDEGKKSWFKRNILKSFVSVCQEIHAIKT